MDLIHAGSLRLDSLVAGLGLAPLLPRASERVVASVLFGAADGLASLIATLVDPHGPDEPATPAPVVPNEWSNEVQGENYMGTYSTAAVCSAQGKLFIGLGGNNYHYLSPGIDAATTPFIQLLWADTDNFGPQTGGMSGGYGYCMGPAVAGDYVVAGALVEGQRGGVLNVYSLPGLVGWLDGDATATYSQIVDAAARRERAAVRRIAAYPHRRRGRLSTRGCIAGRRDARAVRQSWIDAGGRQRRHLCNRRGMAIWLE
jgi:hypothetical protein